MLAAPPEPAIVRVLANPMNRALIAALEEGPSYPRALAQRLQATEGQVQKHLKRMAAAGLVHAAWHHDMKTVKLYKLRAQGARIAFSKGHIVEELDLPADAAPLASATPAPAPAPAVQFIEPMPPPA